jgi:hypothetical protein
MPEEEKKSSTKLVDIDTSGPEIDVTVPELKEEPVVTETETHEETTQDSPITDDTPEKSDVESDVQESEQKESQESTEDSKLEEYSKGVQGRISKLTRKMREAERREAAALDYAKAVEYKRKEMESQFVKRDSVYNKKLEENVKTGMEAAEKELAGAIESGNAPAQVEANKRIATLAFENAKIQQTKEYQEEVEQQPQPKLSDEQYLPRKTPRELPNPDPQAEDWASKNRWFGSDRAMTFTAFEIHKDLVNKEGFDPKSNEYYKEVDRRIKLDFPHKFDKGGRVNTSEPVQTVASAKRSVKPGRQTVRLTSSQVAIAKKLGVPLEEYAKQLKITEGA